MTAPLFIRLRNRLFNLAAVKTAWVEDECLYVGFGEEDAEFEFETEAEAERALTAIQKLLEERGLFLGQPI